MRRILLYLPLLIICISVYGQPPSPEQNYLRSEKFLVPVKDDRSIGTMPPAQKEVDFRYYDALGVEVQKISVGKSPLGNDLISFKRLDEFRREPKSYLPYTIPGNGMYRADPVTEQLRFYTSTPGVVSDLEPFELSVFEESPVNRVKKTFAPGWSWHNDAESIPETSSIRLNVSNEVLLMSVGADGLLVYSPGSFYSPNTLAIKESVLPSGVVTKEYTDYSGNVVLKRTGNGTTWHDTYTIYNSSAAPVVVLTPSGVADLPSYTSAPDKAGFMNKWCYQYRYDEWGRNTEKRIPGAGWVYYVYDRWDRLVFSQDANQRKNGLWSYTKFDIHNRPIMKGIFSGTRESVVAGVNGSFQRFESRAVNSIGYTNVCFPAHSEATLHTITYYDCYNFLAYPGWDTENLGFEPDPDFGLVTLGRIFRKGDVTKVYDPVVRGNATGAKTKILGTTRWLNSVTYYDRDYRVVQTISENHFAKRDVVSIQYNEFTGKPLKKRTTHSGATQTVVVVEEFEYDHAERLLRYHHQINNQPRVLMLSNRYNELGELVEKNIHSQDGVKFLQSIDMKYNIQGWLTHINNPTLTSEGNTPDINKDFFGAELVFNQTVSINNGAMSPRKMFDGNIAAIKWKTDTGAEPATEKIYGFRYDVFGRFSEAYYATLHAGVWTGNPGVFNEEVTGYDNNGNIAAKPNTFLKRSALVNGTKAEIDNLSYTYSGDRLLSVADASAKGFGFRDKPGAPGVNDYMYDDNGNLIFDLNKSISNIRYNFLNLPEEVEITRADLSPARTDRIKFVYDASGKLLKREVWQGSSRVWTTDYVGSLQYDNGMISFFETEEGRAVFTGAAFEYEYFLKDHQGNTRVVYGLGKETKTFLATMENRLNDTEVISYGFRNIPLTRSLGNNITPPGPRETAPDKSARCNAFSNGVITLNPVGPAKQISVTAGDAIYTQVYARFNNVKTSPLTVAASALVSAVTGTFGVTRLENPVLWQSMNNSVPLAAANSSFGTTVPKAYLAVLFFDNSNVFRRAAVHSITERAYQNFEKLSLSFTADIAGSVYIYVVNESNISESVDVYFDDLYIVHEKSNIVPQVFQASDYYPFGLSYNEYHSDRLRIVKTSPTVEYEPVVRNRRLFQAQEIQKDLDLDWYQFKYRMHDPATGRFISIDPLAEEYLYNSTYAFSENKLMHGVELEGLEFKGLFETAKLFSPIAIMPVFSYTNHEINIGVDYSIGLPKALPFAKRTFGGVSFNVKDLIQQNTQIQTKAGLETSTFNGLLSFQNTTYRNERGIQTTGMVTVGYPAFNIQYENDWHPKEIIDFIDPAGVHPAHGGDGGDRHYTAAGQVNFAALSFGFKLATGDPGLNFADRSIVRGGPYGTYSKSQMGTDPDQYRLGLIYGSAFGFHFGINSEHFRHGIQNLLIHDRIGSPRFRFVPYEPRYYFGFSTQSGTQWR